MSEQPLVLYDFRNPEEAFELMRGGKKGIVTEEFVIKLTALITRLQEQLNEANELLNLYLPKKRINSVCVKPINDYKTKWGVK